MAWNERSNLLKTITGACIIEVCYSQERALLGGWKGGRVRVFGRRPEGSDEESSILEAKDVLFMILTFRFLKRLPDFQNFESKSLHFTHTHQEQHSNSSVSLT
jgi:hypothetical protein